MERIPRALFLAATAALVSAAAQGEVAPTTYSLKTVETNPVPKAELFRLWKEVALQACSESKTRFNLGKAECSRIVSERADHCASQLSPQSPSVISTTAVSRDIGRKYLDCATPHYFCNGVEVKTEKDARAQCK